MAAEESTSLLTCTHEGCACRVLIQVPCHCEGAEEGSYMCACGTELVPVSVP